MGGKKFLKIKSKHASIGINKKGIYCGLNLPKIGIHRRSYLNTSHKKANKKIFETEKEASDDLLTPFYSFISIYIITIIILAFISTTYFFITTIIGGIIIYLKYKTPKQQCLFKISKANTALKNGAHKEALTQLYAANDLVPNNLGTLFMIAGILHNFQQYQKAIKFFRKCTTLVSDNDSINVGLASCLYQTQEYENAITLLQKIPDTSQEFLTAMQFLAGCFLAKKRYDEAIETLKRTPLRKRKLTEELKEIHYNLANIYLEKGDSKEALKHLKKVYSVDIEFRDTTELITQIEGNL